MRILGIETSCDETAASVVEDGVHVRSSVIASTKDVFSNTGGVVPEDAARRQVECILPVLHTALRESTVSGNDIDAIAITRGPGLLGSLLVGTTAARTVASLWKKPLIGVHHTFGHLSSTWLNADPIPEFPCITLSVSGGHSDIWYRQSHTKGTLLGRTRDDAAGEAFDKGASMLGLSYPGGPSVSKAAQSGDENSFQLPKALHAQDTLDFSFSGLKTALKYTIRELSIVDCRLPIENLAASYQYAIVLQLADRVAKALKMHPEVKGIHVVGGVSANTRLRSLIVEMVPLTPLFVPTELLYCTDNAAMIAAAGFFLVQEHKDAAYAPFTTSATLPLEECISS